MEFLLSFLILGATTLLFISLIKLPRIAEIILCWFLAAFTNLVFIFQIANLFGQLNSVRFVLILQTVVLFVAFGLWIYQKRPRLFPERAPKIYWYRILKDTQNWPLLGLVGSLTAGFVLYFILIYVVPPNNVDALSIHLARMVKWMQFGSYFPWETRNVWQVSFPVNAQLTYLWTVIFTHTDRFIAYIPCMAGLVTALIVYLLAQENGFDVRPSVFAGAVWLAFPVVQLHLTSVRHDLISTWLFMSSLYFFYRWGNCKKAVYFVLSALSLGLVVGTNFSIATYLPGFGLLLVISYLLGRHKVKDILLYGGLCVLIFILLSSPIYISNMIYFGSPVGPDAAEMTSVAMTQELSIGQYLGINILRWSYQFIDFAALPKPLSVFAVNVKAHAIEGLLGLLNLNFEGDLATMNAHIFHWDTQYALQEDEAWYGLIGVLLVFPTTIASFIKGIKKRDLLLIGPFVFLVTAMATCSLIRPGWTPYDGRYFMPLAAMCAALLPLWFKNEKAGVFVQYSVMLLSILSVVMVVVYNPAKKIIGGDSVWDMNRIDQMTRQSYGSKEMLYLVGEAIPENAVVGIATDYQDYQEYGVYGENFTRTVIDVFPPERISDSEWLESQSIEYLLVMVSDGYPDVVASEYQYVDSLGDWIAYKRSVSP